MMRTVKATNSVLDLWDNLVGAAERGVLQKKRWDDPANPTWKLMHHKKDEFSGKPANKIRQVRFGLFW